MFQGFLKRFNNKNDMISTCLAFGVEFFYDKFYILLEAQFHSPKERKKTDTMFE